MLASLNVKKRKQNIASTIKPEWEELCQECSYAAKKQKWTKEKSRELLRNVREKYNL